jgi:AcrR family transcriptional regulator
VLRAARTEFAAHGFSGAGVDRIAARARVNKAMIYYHFGSKLALYREVLLEGFVALTVNARAAIAVPGSAADRLDRYLESLVATVHDHPYIVPMMLREMAESGRNLDPVTLQGVKHLAASGPDGEPSGAIGLFAVVRDLLQAGEQSGEFAAVDPLLTHFIIIGSSMMYAANEPLRRRIRQLNLPNGPRSIPIGPEPFLRYMSLVLRRTLQAPEVADA